MDEIERQKMLRAQEAEPERIIISRAGLPCQNCATLTAERDRYRDVAERAIKWGEQEWVAHWYSDGGLEAAAEELQDSRFERENTDDIVADLKRCIAPPPESPIAINLRAALAGTGETP